jgi:2-phospho-L-lactate/phosphoenolpyruvate guanylyltransferase
LPDPLVFAALVPIKLGGASKSRLSASLPQEERVALMQQMARTVLTELAACPLVGDIAILAAERPGTWQGGWIADKGRGLNPEITAWREGQGARPILVIHADLPLLRADDVTALLKAASTHGAALATDRAGLGSNALAIADGRPFTFRFGKDSRALHAAQWPDMPVLDIMGLAADMDTPDDLAFACAQGFVAGLRDS